MEELNPRTILAGIVMAVLMWTGTFLHDIDECIFQPALAQADEPAHDHDHHRHDHHGHFYGTSVDGAPIVAMPEMHGHDPSVLSSVRNGQDVANFTPVMIGASAWSHMHIASANTALFNASRERSPPRKTPTYLLYRVMLI